ncbi:MAG: hypothetical protein M1832_003504 [Thelocarpon impressellum]|nr:MAG: hypothetical protein M1832_003504 [Thelocarpon impressellum]
MPPLKPLIGTVTVAARMAKTVKVRIMRQVWNNHIRKEQQYFVRPTSILVHDARDILVEGDVVRVMPGVRSSKSVRHRLLDVVTPFGTRLEDREGYVPEPEGAVEAESSAEAGEGEARRGMGKVKRLVESRRRA